MKSASIANSDKSSSDAAIAGLVLDRNSSQPLNEQLTAQLRNLILSGRIASGARLPSSRALAGELGVSRLTVMTSLDQLAAEGFTEGQAGRGVFVVGDLPDMLTRAVDERAGPDTFEPLPRENPARPVPFQPAAHDQHLFPARVWARELDRAAQPGSGAMYPAGHPDLREAICRHLHDWRGVSCQPRQVLVTAGGADALQLLVRALDLAGRRVLIENPGYPLFMQELRYNGAVAEPHIVGRSGLDPAGLPAAPLAIVTPSRHYPTGATMPLAARLELIGWAQRHDAYIVEDDFDSEYRYRGSPLPSLMGLAPDPCVIYLGSFSKVFSPQLRLGFIVVPDDLAGRFEAVLHQRGPLASAVAQPALAGFMASGRFATHLRRTRRIYAGRQAALVAAVRRHLDALLEVRAEAGGMHLLAELKPALAIRMSDREASRRAAGAGLVVPPLSAFCFAGHARQGLLLGYSGFGESEIETAAMRLARALQK